MTLFLNERKIPITSLLVVLLFTAGLVHISEAQVVNNFPNINDNATTKNYSGKFIDELAITGEMSKDCLVLKHDVKERYEEIDQYKSQLDTLKKKIMDLENHLKEIKEKLSRTDGKSMVAYNGKVILYKSMLTKYNELLNIFNEQVDTHRQMTTKFKKECR